MPPPATACTVPQHRPITGRSKPCLLEAFSKTRQTAAAQMRRQRVRDTPLIRWQAPRKPLCCLWLCLLMWGCEPLHVHAQVQNQQGLNQPAYSQLPTTSLCKHHRQQPNGRPKQRPPRHSHRLHTRGSQQHKGKAQGKLATSTQPQSASVHTCCLYWCYKRTPSVDTTTLRRARHTLNPRTSPLSTNKHTQGQRQVIPWASQSIRAQTQQEPQSCDTREQQRPSQPGDVCVHSAASQRAKPRSALHHPSHRRNAHVHP